MEKKNEKLGVSFTLPAPETVTVRTQMAYLSEASFAYGKMFFERLWIASLTVLTDWKCELIPDPQAVDLDKETNPKITEILFWVGWEVKQYMDALEKIPKN